MKKISVKNINRNTTVPVRVVRLSIFDRQLWDFAQAMTAAARIHAEVFPPSFDEGRYCFNCQSNYRGLHICGNA